MTVQVGQASRKAPKPPHPPHSLIGWTTWWLWRGAYTRSHLELGRENPQRPWYCVLRHGRVGRRQVFQPIDTHHIHRHPDEACGLRQGGVVRDGTWVKKFNAGWSSPVARQAHNLKAARSNRAPATTDNKPSAPNWPAPVPIICLVFRSASN